MAKRKAEETKDAAAPVAMSQLPGAPTAEEQAQIQARQQRARAEVAILKQRFAETDVAKVIAESERDQLIQQTQFLQKRIAALEKEVVALTPKDQGCPSPEQESDDGQTTADDSTPKSEA